MADPKSGTDGEFRALLQLGVKQEIHMEKMLCALKVMNDRLLAMETSTNTRLSELEQSLHYVLNLVPTERSAGYSKGHKDEKFPSHLFISSEESEGTAANALMMADRMHLRDAFEFLDRRIESVVDRVAASKRGSAPTQCTCSCSASLTALVEKVSKLESGLRECNVTVTGSASSGVQKGSRKTTRAPIRPENARANSKGTPKAPSTGSGSGSARPSPRSSPRACPAACDDTDASSCRSASGIENLDSASTVVHDTASDLTPSSAPSTSGGSPLSEAEKGVSFVLAGSEGGASELHPVGRAEGDLTGKNRKTGPSHAHSPHDKQHEKPHHGRHAKAGRTGGFSGEGAGGNVTSGTTGSGRKHSHSRSRSNSANGPQKGIIPNDMVEQISTILREEMENVFENAGKRVVSSTSRAVHVSCDTALDGLMERVDDVERKMVKLVAAVRAAMPDGWVTAVATEIDSRLRDAEGGMPLWASNLIHSTATARDEMVRMAKGVSETQDRVGRLSSDLGGVLRALEARQMVEGKPAWAEKLMQATMMVQQKTLQLLKCTQPLNLPPLFGDAPPLWGRDIMDTLSSNKNNMVYLKELLERQTQALEARLTSLEGEVHRAMSGDKPADSRHQEA
eukprot:Rmarinus@m.24081